jgi:LmbE family N-acetylglucosaminyl deacetylase
MAYDPCLLAASNILVIAPHPDDESLGCGGLISKLAAHGRCFYTIFVTDGGASHLASAKWSRHAIMACREREANDALRQLGIGNHPRMFLRLSDAAMPPVWSRLWRSALYQLDIVLRTFRPDLVLLPWRRDPHCDHRDSWRLAIEAIRQSALTPMTLEYAIWLEENGLPADYPCADEAQSIVFDISTEVANKRAAIATHQSQTTNLIDDDPNAFRLSVETITRLTGPCEAYWQPLT